MSPARRLPQGGRIDRRRRLRFTFDGRSFEGHPGDTLASALLANDVLLVARSFKYHRPRGIFSAGQEEPSALVQLERPGGRRDPNLRATRQELFDGLIAYSQNRWPTLRVDVAALNDRLAPLFPAGFYYKTFMWPRWAWKALYEPSIRRMAGLGQAPTEPDPDRYEHRFAHCDLLVAGAGAAGLVAALVAVRAGLRVIVAEDDVAIGGWLLGEGSARVRLDGERPDLWLAQVRAELEAAPKCRLLCRTTVFGCYDHNFVALLERVADHLPEPPAGLPRQRLWKVRARQVLLATGTLERPIAFPGNDRPGVMLAGAAATYLHRFAVLAGQEVVLFGNHDGIYAIARDLRWAGARVTLVDSRQRPAPRLVDELRDLGCEVRTASVVVGTGGRLRLQQVHLTTRARAQETTGLPEVIPADLLLVSGGHNPDLALFAQARGRLVWEEARGIFLPGEAPWPVRVAGGANGCPTVAAAFADALRVAREIVIDLGRTPPSVPLPLVEEPGAAAIEPLWRVPMPKPRQRAKAFVDLQDDVTVKDLELAIREGYGAIEHLKRYTTTGMGTDQGKTGNVVALGLAAETQGTSVPELGYTTFRQPYLPVPFGAVVGPHRGRLFDPVRLPPSHAWAERQGAVFEPVGQWRRARYFPRTGETMEQAIAREARTVRQACGLMDASTLGKIDVRGPDAAEFLNRLYTNDWKRLAIGRCRYGLLLRDDGMVLDDGVGARLGDHHFHLTTTTGGAARVLAWFEEWLQTEWPHLRVYLTSVTEQWAAFALSGPQAREVLRPLVEGVDLSPQAFPHMSVREGRVAGVPARLFRISFTGELGFEINVPAGYGAYVWERLVEAGEPHGLVVYGTETMHLLRAEKGYIVIGQETDGTVSPIDLGMEWLIARGKGDFLGSRSLARPEMRRPDRKQLVGLLPRDPAMVLDEGAQIVEDPTASPPAPTLGHVTSSYASPNLGRTFALALVAGGRSRIGQQLYVTRLEGPPVAVEVTAPVFWDPEGKRLHA
ncbi:Sarcosine oxidase subunit alpha [bacterium HR40]|nr:Sarcosine oxidase subunit alpha [bacterium HR40]